MRRILISFILAVVIMVILTIFVQWQAFNPSGWSELGRFTWVTVVFTMTAIFSMDWHIIEKKND